jgi:hypothetical protein
MKSIKRINKVLAILVFSVSASACVPLTNLEGVGGMAFNPLAYPANPGTSLGDPNSSGMWRHIGMPQVGAWYVNLGESNPAVDWTSIGVTETFFGRWEVSYGREGVDPETLREISKESFGTKLLLVEENAMEQEWLPAISAGLICKHTDENPYESSAGVDKDGYDIYAVATKMITSFTIPILISGGVMSTDSRTTGVFGYDEDRDLTGFGNLDLVLCKYVALGVEYKQGADYDDWKDADYWDVHLAWFVNSHATLAAAYVNTGNEDSASRHGLGEGLVLSLQYAF